MSSLILCHYLCHLYTLMINKRYIIKGNEILSFYRRTNNSLSANKFVALKRTWNLYRKVEHLNLFSSLYNFIIYCFNAVKRRV